MTQRKVVITGAAGGIGIALVDEFRAHGWRVIGVDVSPPSTDAQIDEWVEGDLKDASTRTAIRHAVKDSADALVNNAALQINSPFRKMTETELFQSFETNLFASVLLTQEIAGARVDRRGAIVNVGTVHSVATSANVFPYSISKAALSGFTRSVAIEMAAEQVRCNSVLLGAVDTPMLRAGLSGEITLMAQTGTGVNLLTGHRCRKLRHLRRLLPLFGFSLIPISVVTSQVNVYWWMVAYR